MNICVFLSAADLDDRYTRPAREFAELLGKGGHTLVWGGSESGLMKSSPTGCRRRAAASWASPSTSSTHSPAPTPTRW